MKTTLPRTDIAEKLKAYRALCHLTQEELSTKLGVSLKTVVSWEQGWRKPDLFSILRLEQVTGVSMEEWLEGIPTFHLPHGSGPRHRKFH